MSKVVLSAVKRKAVGLIKKLDVLRGEITELNSELAIAKIKKENIELGLCEALATLKEYNIPGLPVSGIGVVSLRVTVFGNVTAENREAALKFFEAEGLEESMVETKIVKRQLNAWVAKRLADMKKLPACIDSSTKHSVVIRKEKEGKK